MGKLLRLRDYVLIAGALAGELFEDIRLVGGLVPAAMEAQYGFIPRRYKRSSYLSTVSQMLSTGDIERKVDKKGNVFLELTSGGKNKMRRRFPLFPMAGKKWDGIFMIVIFDIPEKQRVVRDNLRDKLRELGFGMLQESVWISPYHFEEDLREFLILNGLKNVVFVLSARKLFAGDMKLLAKSVWRLDSIVSGYLEVLEELKKIKQAKESLQKGILKRAYDLYLGTLTRDPLLPRELLPTDWPRESALRSLNSAFFFFKSSKTLPHKNLTKPSC